MYYLNRYNKAVQTYNNKVKRFPGSIIANMTGFEPRAFFTAVDGADKAPSVNFD
ncbi:LemA family protein [Carnobacterium maltaromaticum]|uniref:LemA family protein n=1 Tax=Carnobacterium maltaromaticum TaxID=2751 RepID=UPI003B9858BD